MVLGPPLSWRHVPQRGYVGQRRDLQHQPRVREAIHGTLRPCRERHVVRHLGPVPLQHIGDMRYHEQQQQLNNLRRQQLEHQRQNEINHAYQQQLNQLLMREPQYPSSFAGGAMVTIFLGVEEMGL